MTLRPPNRARLTPGYVHSMSFRLARLGRRGLDEDDVRDFCARVETELARLLAERAALYAELRRLSGRARNGNRAGTAVAMPLGAPVAAAPREAPSAGARSQESNVQAVRILAKAQQTAERCIADAQAYSREVAHEAQRRRDKILAEASARATVLLEQAHRAATRAALGPPATHHDQLTRPGQAAYPGGARYPGRAAYPDRDAEHPAHPAGDCRGPASDDREAAGDCPGPAGDDREAAADYPGTPADYPGNPANYPDAAIQQRRYPVRYDRFPF